MSEDTIQIEQYLILAEKAKEISLSGEVMARKCLPVISNLIRDRAKAAFRDLDLGKHPVHHPEFAYSMTDVEFMTTKPVHPVADAVIGYLKQAGYTAGFYEAERSRSSGFHGADQTEQRNFHLIVRW